MIVYVDAFSDGHHAECLVFFSQLFLKLGIPFEVHAPTTSWNRARDLLPQLNEVHFVAEDGLQGKGALLAKIRKLRALQRQRRDKQIDLVFFAIVDPFVLPLAIAKFLGAFRLPWSGIFLRDSFSDPTNPSRTRVEKAKARIKLSLLRFASTLGAGLVTFSRSWSAKMPVPVYLLPDSLSEIDRRIALVTRNGAIWPAPSPHRADQRLRLLLFGALSERKGAVELLDAMSLLPDADLNRLSVSIVGTCTDAYFAELISRARSLEGRGGRVELEQGYATPEDLLRRLVDCHIIAAPYRGHVGSSAVPSLAAQLGRPVLGPSEFQFGGEMREFDLGVIVEDNSTEALAAALRKLLDQPPGPSEGMRRMAQLRNYPAAQASAAKIISELADIERRPQLH